MILDAHGGAFRCLLHIREDAGNLVLPYGDFEKNYLSKIHRDTDLAHWNLLDITKMASALGLAAEVQGSNHYEHILENHRAGRHVLIRISGSSFPLEEYGNSDFRITVLADMDEDRLSVWCPIRNGDWDILPPIYRADWEATDAMGITLLTNKDVTALRNSDRSLSFSEAKIEARD